MRTSATTSFLFRKLVANLRSFVMWRCTFDLPLPLPRFLPVPHIPFQFPLYCLFVCLSLGPFKLTAFIWVWFKITLSPASVGRQSCLSKKVNHTSGSVVKVVILILSFISILFNGKKKKGKVGSKKNMIETLTPIVPGCDLLF